MIHAGKAARAALKLILLAALILGSLAVITSLMSTYISGGLLVVWILFTIFTFYFFRDPTAQHVEDHLVIVSPAHGTIDHIDETIEPQFMLGPCRRVSIFLSVVDVHVQKAPVSGKVLYLQHTSGRFLNAMKTDSAQHNENV